MSTKKKVIKSFGILCFMACLAFVSAFMYGCSKSSSISGKFTFETTDAHATITAEVNGAAAGVTNPDKLEFKGSVKPTEAQLACWNKNLSFAKKSETFTYTITITNDSSTNAMLTSIKNTSVEGKVGQAVNLKVNGANATYESEKVYRVNPNGSVVLTLTFTEAEDKGDVGSYGYEVTLKDELNATNINATDKALILNVASAIRSKGVTSATPTETMFAKLAEADLTYAEMQTTAENTYLYWIKDTNSIVYTNADDEVLYTNSKTTPNANTQNWVSLTGTIPTEDYTISGEDTAVVTVANAKQLYKLSLDLYKNPSSETYYNFNNIIDSLYVGSYTETNEQKIALHERNGANAIGEKLIKEIVLANDIDMRGIDLCFGNNGITGKGSGAGVKQRDAYLTELTFNGNGKELTNIYATTADFYNGEYKTY